MPKYLDLESIKYLAIYTGTKGREQCACRCAGCLLQFWGERKVTQGSIENVHELIKTLPNLSCALLCGNPDPCVDTDFCNAAAKVFQQHGIRTSFYTSGIGGVKTLEKLFDGIDLKCADIIFSLDSLDNKKLAILKGRKEYTLEKVTECFDWCRERKIKMSSYSTVWQINVDEDWLKFHEYCKEHGVKHMTLSIGSQHLGRLIVDMPYITPVQGKVLREKYRGLFKISNDSLPRGEEGFLPLCRNEKNGQMWVYLMGDKVMACCCDALALTRPEFLVDLSTKKVPIMCDSGDECPRDVQAQEIDPEYYYSCLHYRI